jgi:bifunctional DNA-binding transcriptional regulator/antitoxin component of YhaV-PrlF toxin-antitoxin module
MPRVKKTKPGFSEGQRKFKAGPAGSELPERLDLQLGPGGRVVIPAVFRKAIEVEEGGRLMARVVDGELRLITPQMAIKRVQRIVRETIPAGADLVADLLEMRRQEVADELGEDG